MKLSLQTDYSLRTLMFLAARPERQTVAAIAAFFQISQTHVGKVVHQLARLGYVRSIRGIGGGLELAKSPNDITVGEVVQAVEGNVHLLECVGMKGICVIQRYCKLRTVLDRAEKIQFDYLNSVRLSDILPFGSPQRIVRASVVGNLTLVSSSAKGAGRKNAAAEKDGSSVKSKPRKKARSKDRA